MSFDVNFDPTLSIDFVDRLQSKITESIRPATQAGSQVIYEAVKQNVSNLKQYTGNLSRSIYQKYSPESSVDGQSALYRISWNARTAPHGGLVEFGHLIRYKYYQDENGKVRPMVRAGMEGKPKPRSRAEKDAYYVTLSTPVQVPGKFFVKSAYDKLPEALEAVQNEISKRIGASA